MALLKVGCPVCNCLMQVREIYPIKPLPYRTFMLFCRSCTHVEPILFSSEVEK